jgi:hypothetical protein
MNSLDKDSKENKLMMKKIWKSHFNIKILFKGILIKMFYSMKYFKKKKMI